MKTYVTLALFLSAWCGAGAQVRVTAFTPAWSRIPTTRDFLLANGPKCA
jgi:hypothetical protein